MCSAPHRLDSVCALSPKLSKALRSSNQENFAPVARPVVPRQARELILLHQRALRSNRLEVMLRLRGPGSSRPAAQNPGGRRGSGWGGVV